MSDTTKTQKIPTITLIHYLVSNLKYFQNHQTHTIGVLL